MSRQTLFLAFGNRAGVLVAMARHQDTRSDHVLRLRQIAATGADAQALHAFVDAWQDRIFSQGVRVGLDRILGQIAAGGGLQAEQDPSRLADLCLTLIVPSAWRYLVVERGWTAEAFARSRHLLLDALLASAFPAKRSQGKRPLRR